MIRALTSASELMPWVNTAVIKVHPILGPALAAGVALTFAITVLLVQRKGGTKEDPALGYAWAITTMLVVSPIVWLHYLAWLLIAVAACLPYVRGWRGIIAIGLVSLFLLLSTPGFLAAATVAMLLCWVVTGVLYVQSSHSSGLKVMLQRRLALAGDTLS